MADFAQQVSDAVARQRLARALSGRGAFLRFKNELSEEYPDRVPSGAPAPSNAMRETGVHGLARGRFANGFS
jgi:hypothetical protein